MDLKKDYQERVMEITAREKVVLLTNLLKKADAEKEAWQDAYYRSEERNKEYKGFLEVLTFLLLMLVVGVFVLLIIKQHA